MLFVHDNLAPFDPVAASKTARTRVAEAGTYFELGLYVTTAGVAMTEAQVRAQVGEMRLILNGEVVRRHTAGELIDLNKYHGRDFEDGHLDIFLAENWRRHDVASDYAFAWGMRDVTSFIIEVDFTASALTPGITGTSKSTIGERNLGPIKKIRSYSVSVSATGARNWLEHPRTEPIEALHCVSTDILDIAVTADKRKIYDLTQAESDRAINRTGLYSAQTGYFHVPFNTSGLAGDALPMVNEILDDKGRVVEKRNLQQLEIEFNMNAATGFTVISETIGTL